MGEYAMEQLRLLKTQCNIIKEIRGVGLMIGIELAINGSTIIKECIQAGLFLNCTHDTVIRFMPPLNVKKEHIDEGLGILKSVLSNY